MKIVSINGPVCRFTRSSVESELKDYNQYCYMFGLKPEWLGRDFHFNGGIYTVVGLKLRSRKYPVIVSRFGKRYKLPAVTVVNAFNQQ